MPELKYPIEAFLTRNGIPYKTPFFGEQTIERADAERAMQLYYQKTEEKRIEEEEKANKKRAMAQMLITSGFNFDGYRIVKYSG